MTPWADPELALKPADKKDFLRELTACLALCGGIGMTEDNRREWIRAAWGTLDGIPADLLERGCAEARRTCDHPSKIVPTILREVETAWRWRKEGKFGGQTNTCPPPQSPKPEYCTPEQAAAIMEEFGLRSETRETIRRHLGPPRKPTRQDYIDMGVDPAVLDAEAA